MRFQINLIGGFYKGFYFFFLEKGGVTLVKDLIFYKVRTSLLSNLHEHIFILWHLCIVQYFCPQEPNKITKSVSWRAKNKIKKINSERRHGQQMYWQAKTANSNGVIVYFIILVCYEYLSNFLFLIFTV